ncbi:aminoglycoside phosphotransferase [Glycomyces mayteni]|uniref:Aminoglycoside phosphotransferase n=1 Tax=Glycomyces mayteni TaxID=543887 RepID=A0ABW2DCX0_9ACTN
MLADPRHSPVGAPVRPVRAFAHNTGNQATGGIWQVTGPGGDAVLKHLTPAGDGAAHWAASEDPGHWNYWRREQLAYESGFAAGYGIGAGIGAPGLLACGERPDGSVELWLEHVEGTAGRDCTVEELAEFARRLGTVQGRKRTVEPWHSRNFLRQYAGRREFGPLDWDHPAAAAHWPADLREGLRLMWERRTDLFGLAEAAPQTVCHLDVWPMNLRRRPDGEFALLDWSFTGAGALGEDLANLIADTFFDGLQPVDRLADAETALTTAYLEGLRGAGYRGEAAVRKAVAAAGAAKYCWLAPAMLGRLAAGGSVASADYDGAANGAVMERRRPIFAMLVRWARTALTA